MANLPLDPLVRVRDDGLQLSYQLPHRVYDAKSYPVQAPNGSSIILYGHGQGIRVIWRGGREFKAPREEPESSQEPAKTNGTNEDAIMIIDSDEEDQPAPAKAEDTSQSAIFEEEEDEVDPSRPFQTILRYIDISLGTKVLNLAVPGHQREEARSRLESSPTILSSMIVLAAACGDGSLKVVALPLTPPLPTVKDSAALGIQVVTLNEGLVQTVPTGVSLTFTRRRSDGGRTYTSQSRSRSGKSTPDSRSTNSWDILLAAHSAEASGTLWIYQVPIVQQESASTYTFSTDSIVPLQHHYLASPATSISFNPCQYPSERHHHLLVTFANGCVKTYACLATKSRKPISERRTSVADIDIRETEGRWLLSLYPEFETDSSRRKTVVDAQWALGGKAMIALLSDGTWGVWDIDGSGPGRRERTSYLQSQEDRPAISGAVVKTFAVAGRVPGSSTASKPLLSTQPEQKSTFMPMTPSTRRIREDTLFKGSPAGPTLHSTRGGISLVSTGISRDGLADESIFIWHGDKNLRIPSLLAFWRSSIRPTGTFDPSSRSRPALIENVNLFGEMQNGVDHLPHGSPSKTAEKHGVKHDVLITAEHRLIILTPKAAVSEDQALAAAAQDDTIASQSDQLLLKRGQLDLEGMDRVLAGMASGSKSASAIRSPQKRRLFS